MKKFPHHNQEELSEDVIAKCMLLDVGLERYPAKKGGWLLWNSYNPPDKDFLWKVWSDEDELAIRCKDPEELLRMYVAGKGHWD